MIKIDAKCPDCGAERRVWVNANFNGNIRRCPSCAALLRRGGRGGRVTTAAGYIQIHLKPDDFFYPMAQFSGYVKEHRLVVAKALGRCLHSWEIVHHKHDRYPAGSIEDKQDNRYPENLQLVSDDRHKQITVLENKMKCLEDRVTLLEAENLLLREEKYLTKLDDMLVLKPT